MQRVARVRARLLAAGLPLLPTVAQILPLMIGDSARCQAASDRLLAEHGIYLQPINYPTVPRGAERLRLTPGPLHSDAMEDALLRSLAAVLDSSGRRVDSSRHAAAEARTAPAGDA
jgi:5-aminolevulinate synthase